MIQTFVKMSKISWIEKLENDLSVMRLAPKKFKREIAEKEAILSVLNAVELDEPKKSVDVPENVAELLDYYRNSSDVDLLALILTFHDWYYCQNEDTQHDKHDKAVDWLIENPEKFMRAWLDGYDSKKKPLESNEETYLTVEQYDYARKTGDWESGEVLTHGQALNDDQKIVLEWLKSNRNSLKVPMLAFYELAELADENTNLAYHQLD
ncbi:DUF1642 domain-containing protein, partial [Enterococcus faecium]|uniref:DUF1642 domain-containing protein n=1 Tax=Enterococcus faecium TaxID=1352 RepID=UPI00161315C5